MGIGMLRRHYPERNVAAFPHGVPDESWKVDQLRAFARAHNVDLKGATKKADILSALAAAKPDPVPFDPGEHEPAEVLEYLTGLDDTDADAHDAEVARVVEAERVGKNRAEVLELIEGTPAD
ncbi:hypothetical protein M768_13900 [Cellulosimicrobium cellulans F16]|uniref:Uncharacterized protein n=1 Tax=Cellulosimicrobium cellulans F16 TaxID=1350482 RepID=A0A0M0F5X6_CELCE|nr:hypothetical protein [Cellulosimicrobium cellulans]KON72596.1 hypothetical protein M768_13900 [Cellulosimicrobium cellulans F16]